MGGAVDVITGDDKRKREEKRAKERAEQTRLQALNDRSAQTQREGASRRRRRLQGIFGSGGFGGGATTLGG